MVTLAHVYYRLMIVRYTHLQLIWGSRLKR
jgi:hypothetical protein